MNPPPAVPAPGPAPVEPTPQDGPDAARLRVVSEVPARPAPPDRTSADVVETVWHGGMSEDRYRRLLALLFGPEGDDGDDAGGGEAR